MGKPPLMLEGALKRLKAWVAGDAVSWLFRILFVAAMAVLLLSCAQIPSDGTNLTWAPKIKTWSTSSDSPSTSVRLSVLTYNVAGLPWPVASGRRQALHTIGQEIGQLVRAGVGPDIVLIQEGFVEETSAIGTYTGYTEHAEGPGQTLPPHQDEHREAVAQTVNRRWWKGEGVGPWVGSGLHIFSAYPIVSVKRLAFGSTACAGYDCLANKGAVLVRILIPGVPDPVHVLTTHFNSTNAAGVSKSETDAAHKRQVWRLKHFLNEQSVAGIPIIMAGDFNTRGSQGRFIHLAKHLPRFTFVKDTCRQFGGSSECAIDFTRNAPWLHSQDLQAFRSGSRVSIRPTQARTVFSADDGRTMLSDHTGYLVTYTVWWDGQETNAPALAEAHSADLSVANAAP